MTRIQANLVLLLTGAVWGMGFVAQSSAMSDVGPWTFTAARFLLAALTLLPFALWEGRRASARPVWPLDHLGFGLCGAMLFAGTILQQIGMLSTSVTNSGFLTGLYVVLTPVAALLLFRRRPHWVTWPAAILATLGLLLAGGGTLDAIGGGDWLTIAGALAFAFQIVFVGLFATRTGRPLTLTCVQFAAVTLLAAPGLVFEPFSLSGLAAVLPQIVYGGCVSAGLAFTLQTVAQRWTTAPQAALFLSSEAVFAALFGAILLGERIAPIGYAGCLLMLVAMLAVELAPLRWPMRNATRPADEAGMASQETRGR